jgi:hypothetical protein
MSYEEYSTAAMMNSRSSTVNIVFILVKVDLDFFREVGFMGETFILFKGSASSTGFLGTVTFPYFC